MRTGKRESSMEYQYQVEDENIDFDTAVLMLRTRIDNKVEIGGIDNASKNTVEFVYAGFRDIGIEVKKIECDVADYHVYLDKAGYKRKYPDYYSENFYEKTLEHYLVYTLAELGKGDSFIDIGSEHSPLSEIFGALTGCHGYSQDIMYPEGVHRNKIGCDAANIPFEDGFFKAAAVTCTLEHFEKDADIRFMREMARVIEAGGRVVIAPLYMYTLPSCQTDPLKAISGNVTFDPDAVVFCARGWNNRHGRHYSPDTLYHRLIKPNRNLNFEVFVLENPSEIDESVYCRFILRATKS